ncbi:MAG: tetratricopeptide repeat protein [Deltaproteobacteria bacterium]|nr:tetratricopeptide repeat protein [Deltaproteobacteria bacterium]
MKSKRVIMVLALVTALALVACGASLQYMKAGIAAQQNKFDEAISIYRELLAANPNDVQALKGLGEVYLRMKKAPEAIAALEKAHSLAPGDREIVLDLGLAYELGGDYGKAIDTLKSYASLNPSGAVAERINKHLTVLLYKEASARAKEAVKQEKSLGAASADPNALAVTYFGDKGITDTIRPLQKALAAMVITDLSNVKSLRVLERVKMQKVLEEMKLGKTGVVDAKTAARGGRLLGAGKVVSGNMAGMKDDSMRLNSVLTNVTTSKDVGDQEAQGKVAEFFTLEKAIVFGIIDDLGIKLSGEQKAVVGKHATLSLPAILCYGEGLDAQDRGDWDLAITKYKCSADADPAGPGKAALGSAPTSAEAAASIDDVGRDVSSCEANEAKQIERESKGGGGGC